MSATIEIKYYNSFWLKKMASISAVSSLETTGTGAEVLPNTAFPVSIGINTITIANADATSVGIGQSLSYTISSIEYIYTIILKVVGGSNTVLTLSKVVTGSPSVSTELTFGKITNNVWLPSQYDSDADADWYIEETRIRGGYNNTNLDLGVKAYIVEESPQREKLLNTLIYSGVFNSRTGVNNTNQFSVAEDITRTVDPAQGSIQKLYAEDTNLIIFQELKVSRALIDKDAIYSAEGQPMTTSGSQVIGQIQSYAGNYGIGSHPESFAVYGYRKYFVDNYQNIVLRLSQDGITEISAYGMFDYFRDELSDQLLSDGYIYGLWDIHSKQYVISIQPTSGKPSTLSFDEDVNGWVSRLSYTPNSGASLRNNFYTFKSGSIWKHYVTSVPKARFYNTNYSSDVTFVFNPSVSESKSFLTINYEGSQNWKLTSFETETDVAAPIGQYYFPSTLIGLQDQLFQNKFKKKENKYFANLLNISNIQNGDVLYADPIANPNNGQIISGVKGFYATTVFTCT
ncbi:MAG: hypothetical protein ACOVK2_04315, partial [Candidatus Fonsibacter sp.]